MLEYRLEPEGGLLVCALGTLEVGGGQIVECSLCLSDILPERRVALAVELLEGEQLRGTRLYTVPPHHEDCPDPFEGPFGALKIYTCIFRLLSL